VAVVDFDVHHGNGTQHQFEDRGDVLVISLHQHPRTLYPGTGFEHETGVGAGVGATMNIPLLPHGNDAVYQKAFEEKVLPALEVFEPQFLLISAGFDAAEADPLAQLCVTTAGFRWMIRQLADFAGRFCAGRVVSMLEGGYDLRALAEGVAVDWGAVRRSIPKPATTDRPRTPIGGGGRTPRGRGPPPRRGLRGGAPPRHTSAPPVRTRRFRSLARAAGAARGMQLDCLRWLASATRSGRSGSTTSSTDGPASTATTSSRSGAPAPAVIS